ncbi:MAG: LysR family transcriptional regulator [Pseudomonadota bacterium]
MSQLPCWADMPYFLAVARGGSLRVAAEATGATHATVDRHLRSLETHYGVALFERSRTGLRLTEEGAAVLPAAEAAEAAVVAAERRVSGLAQAPEGRVHLSVSPSLAFMILPGMLASFHDRHPGIDVDITVTNRSEDLTRSEAEVGLRVAYEVSGAVTGRKVLTYSKAIYASPDYLDRLWDSRGPDGEGLSWVGWREEDDPPKWVLESPFPKAKIRHGAREGVMVAEMVMAGMGMAPLPCFAAHGNPRLMRVPGTVATPDRSIFILLHSDLASTRRVRLFVDHLAAEIKARRDMFLGETRDQPAAG